MRFKQFMYSEMAMQTGTGLALIDEELMVLFSPTSTLKQAARMGDFDAMEQSGSVLGVVETRDNTLYQSDEIDQIWAERGYGPLLYLLTMTRAGDYGLTPSRIRNQVSPQAQNVWSQFASGKGKDFVTSSPLVNDEGEQAAHHEEPHLNQKYVIKQAYPEYKKMLMRGKRFFAKDQYDEWKTHLLEFGDAKLRGEMNQIYGDK